jgi:tyrosine-protein kinase Etk/Wzc
MNDTQSSMGPPPERAASEVQLIDLLIVLAEHRKLMLGLPLLLAVLAAALSFLIPPAFVASTTLLPPQQSQSGAAALLSQLGGVANVVGGGAGAGKNPSDLYVVMLKSRSVADQLVVKFGLNKVYGVDSREKARAALAADTRISVSKEGLILLEVEGLDQKTVAPIANGYVDELLKLTRTLALTEASQRRKFFEYQLEQAKDKLAAAEISLRTGMATHGVISVDSDSRAMMEVVGRLRAQITAKEIQISAMRSFVTENNQEHKRAQEELNSLRAELGRLENGPRALAEGSAEPAPAGGLDNIKLLRDVKYHQMLYELLGRQYELARLDEAKEGSVIQVLDSAFEPERKFKPKRALLVLGAALAGLFLATLWACLVQLRRNAAPAQALKYAQFKARLRGK